MRRHASEIAVALLVAANLAVVTLIVLVSTGTVGEQTPLTQPAVAHAQPVRPPPAPEPRAPAERVSQRAPAARPRVVSVIVSAVRGDCWISAHSDSQTGPLLAERLLAAGATLTLRARRIWLELGAAGNVDVSVNGKPRTIPLGTTQIVLN